MSDIATHFGSVTFFLELCEESLEEDLTEWEAGFVLDLMNNALEYGDDCVMTDRQADKFRSILDKYA